MDNTLKAIVEPYVIILGEVVNGVTPLLIKTNINRKMLKKHVSQISLLDKGVQSPLQLNMHVSMAQKPIQVHTHQLMLYMSL